MCWGVVLLQELNNLIEWAWVFPFVFRARYSMPSPEAFAELIVRMKCGNSMLFMGPVV
jgi:hypothetical protein